MTTKTCSITMVSPIDHIAMNHQNHNEKNGFGDHVHYNKELENDELLNRFIICTLKLYVVFAHVKQCMCIVST
jgi:hypothetical protein